MGIMVEWDDRAQTVVRMTFNGHWSLAQFGSANTQTALMVRSMPHLVYVISDLSGSDHIPAGMLWKLREISGGKPPNWGGGIVISNNGFVLGLVDMFGRIYMPAERRLFIVRTNAEAYAIIENLKRDHRVD